jgi:hypothetical protein
VAKRLKRVGNGKGFVLKNAGIRIGIRKILE